MKGNNLSNARVINSWNSVTKCVVTSPSMMAFKNTYGRYLIIKAKRGYPYESLTP